MALATTDRVVGQVIVVADSQEFRPIPIAELLHADEPPAYFDNVVTNPARRTEFLRRVAEYIDRPGLLDSGFTVTYAANTGNFLINPKAVFGA